MLTYFFITCYVKILNEKFIFSVILKNKIFTGSESDIFFSFGAELKHPDPDPQPCSDNSINHQRCTFNL